MSSSVTAISRAGVAQVCKCPSHPGIQERTGATLRVHPLQTLQISMVDAGIFLDHTQTDDDLEQTIHWTVKK